MADTVKEGDHLLRIGDLARQTGKSVRAIHLYEELDLLRPVTRSSGGFRLYHSVAVQRVRWIELLRGLGLSLQEMRAILRNWSGERVGPVAMSELRELFRRKLDETRQAIARHQDLERELVDSLHYLSTCEVCDSPRATNVCVECPQDHGMEHEPALVAGLFSARKERLPRRPKPRAGFVRMEDVGRG